MTRKLLCRYCAILPDESLSLACRVVSNQPDVHSVSASPATRCYLLTYLFLIYVYKQVETTQELRASDKGGCEPRTMRLCLEIIVGSLLTLVLVASTSVLDSDDAPSMTVGASWLQRHSDVVDEVVHSLESYDEPKTNTTSTPDSTHSHDVSLHSVNSCRTFIPTVRFISVIPKLLFTYLSTIRFGCVLSTRFYSSI